MSPTGTPSGADLRPARFSDLKGWWEAEFSCAWTAFRAGMRAIDAALPPLRPGVPPSAALIALARDDRHRDLGPSDARVALEQWFEPFEIRSPGFLTGYYEPIVDAAWEPSAAFAAPILSRPENLVTFPPGTGHPSIETGYSAACRLPGGGLTLAPDRAAIEDQAIRQPHTALVWLRDWVEVFLVQVQGSARLRFPDGSVRRLIYAGRNGHPYTSIGRRLIERGAIAAEDMSLERLKTWLRDNGQAPGEAGRLLMQSNASYIFFRLGDATEDGPVGGAGVPLTPFASIAVDRTIWSYGIPFWIEADEPLPGFGPDPLGRLFVAQDTGSAIVGQARADLFMGSGDGAGSAAGAIRHPARFTVFLPRDR